MMGGSWKMEMNKGGVVEWGGEEEREEAIVGKGGKLI